MQKIIPAILFLVAINLIGKFPFLIFFIIILAILYTKLPEQNKAAIKDFIYKIKNGDAFSGSAKASSASDDIIIDVNKLNNMQNAKTWVSGIFFTVFGLWLFFSSIIIVDAGETGVYSLFGKVKDNELRSGFHLVIPLAHVEKMSIRTEEYTMSIVSSEGNKAGDDSITALTKEGLSVGLDLTALYHLDEGRASDVYKTVGIDYDEKIIRPIIRTAIRDVVASYEAKELYSAKREEAAQKIKDQVQKELDSRGIVLEDMLLRDVRLPDDLAKSIQEKLQAEQSTQKYDFLLQTERKEKERKRIEAEGQRDAQKIINESLSTNYLYYQYINTLKDRQGTIYVPTSPTTGMPTFKELGK